MITVLSRKRCYQCRKLAAVLIEAHSLHEADPRQQKVTCLDCGAEAVSMHDAETTWGGWMGRQ